MFSRDMTIAGFDDALFDAMQKEVARQEAHIELIASENYASPRVMEAQGSQLTNKYAEGYPGKRYYGGCEYVDIVEQLAIDYAKQLFGATYANVQTHSGSQANGAVFQALVKPGDTILGMSLDAGGHLTHGARPNFSGKHYNAVQYGIDENGRIDYDEVARLAREHQPKMIIAGFSAYSQIIDWAKFREIADEVGAYLLVDMAHVAGLVAAGIYPNPLPHAHVVTTTTHKTLRGPRGGLILSAEGDADIEKKLQSAVFPGIQGGPLEHVIAAKAVCFKEAMEPEFNTYQQQVVKNAHKPDEIEFPLHFPQVINLHLPEFHLSFQLEYLGCPLGLLQVMGIQVNAQYLGASFGQFKGIESGIAPDIQYLPALQIRGYMIF